MQAAELDRISEPASYLFIRVCNSLQYSPFEAASVTTVSGRSNTVTLDETAANILHSTFMSEHDVTCDKMHKQLSGLELDYFSRKK